MWIGEALGPVERACLRSAMRNGHCVKLYCYDAVGGIPEGVEVADAAIIVPRERIVRYANGSVALFANLFRYELQRRGEGLWADTDHYFLKPHDFARAHVFGLQQNGRVANGVMRLPADCPVLPPLIALFDGSSIAPWATERERQAGERLIAEHGHVLPEKMEWGYTGPRAFSHYLAEFGLDAEALAPDVLYPAPTKMADWIADPERTIEEFTTPQTVGIHLWNQKIKHFKNEPAPRGSFLARLQNEGAWRAI